MYQATYKYTRTLNGKWGTEKIVIKGETALGFYKNFKQNWDLSELSDFPIRLESCSFCSIDGICVKQSIFINEIKKVLEEKEKQVLKEAPPLQHLKIQPYFIKEYGLRSIGKTIHVTKPPRQKEFFDIWETMPDSEVVTLYHGTNAKNVPDILSEGFRKSKRGAFGVGLYCGPIEKAKGFSSKSRKYWQRDYLYSPIFEFDVLLGKCWEADKPTNKFPNNYDSICYDGFRNTEYCLKNPHQVLIKKILLQ